MYHLLSGHYFMLATYQTNGHKLNWMWWERVQHIENQVVWKYMLFVCFRFAIPQMKPVTLNNVILGNHDVCVCVTRKRNSLHLSAQKLTKLTDLKTKPCKHCTQYHQLLPIVSSKHHRVAKRDKLNMCVNRFGWYNNINDSIYHDDQNWLTHTKKIIWCHTK